MLARLSGDYAWARELLEESLGYMRECGDRRGTAFTLNNLGQLMRVEGNLAQAWVLLKESLDAAREVGDKPYTGWALQCLGEVARQQGNFDEARASLTEGLLILRDVGHERHISQDLGALGILEMQQGEYARGVRLISAANTIHDQVRASLDADEKAAWDDNLAAARTALGEAAFEQASAEGRDMSRNQAIEYALGE
jgi:tetratricopeptide (TPR) repeat protein